MASSFSSSLMVENAVMGDQKAVIDELVHGRDLANQLRAILSRPGLDGGGDGDGGPAEGLLSQIMTSFTNTLFMLDKNDEGCSFGGGLGNDCGFVGGGEPTTCPPESGLKSDDSEESSRSVSTVARKDRRGCYKRRKSSNSWKRETPNLIDDGHAWRKYGQKAILKSKFPRNYFRCTHKYDQKCQATKHVQRIQEDPPMYRTTYYGSHTCRNLLSPPELVLDCPSPTHDTSNSMLLSFNLASKHSHNNNHHRPFFPPSSSSPSPSPSPLINPTATTSAVKQEFRDENNTAAPTFMMPRYNVSNGTAGNNNNRPSDHHLPGFDDDDQRLDLGYGVLIGIESFEDDVFQHLDFD